MKNCGYEQKQNEFQRVKRGFRMVVECNQALINAENENNLLNEICQIITNVGKYRFAWIGLAIQDSNKKVIPVAQAGFGTDYLDNMIITWSDSKYGKGPTGTAIRNNRPIIVNDILSTASYAPWCVEASQRGYFSSAAFPFVVNGKSWGALNIYAQESNAFDTAEIKTLTILADSISYGVNNLRKNIEREQSALELEISKARYEGIFQNTKNAVAVFNVMNDGKTFIYRDVNNALKKIEKVEGTSILGKSICEMFPKIREFGFLDVLKRVWRTGKSEHFPVAFYEDDRISGWRDYFIYKLPSDEIASVYSDETKNEYAKESLLKSRERYQRVVEDMPALICRFLPNGEITFVNSLFQNFFKKNYQELVGDSIFNYIRKEEREIVRLNLSSLTYANPIISYENKLVTPGGGVHLFQRTDRALFDDNGNLVEYQSIGSDITKQKKAEEALLERKERYRILTENVADGIILIQNEKLCFVNKAFSTMLGYSQADQLIGYKFAQLIVDDQKQDFIKLYKALVTGELTEKKLQTRCLSKNGQIFWIEGHYTVLQWQGGPAVLATAIDITEIKVHEIALEKNAMALHNENLRLKATLKERYKFGEIIGKSPSMKRVYNQILQASASGINVIISGETGTGKELIARTIHEMSDRSDREFVPVNCGAIPESIFESEFFGHKKGSFTGAYTDKPGFFDLAQKGTLFLDEVGELTLNMQVKLLRAIEGGGYTPVGENKIKKVDVRIISATNRNLPDLVKKGIMREDFFYRIHIFHVHVPPLKERKEDIPLLVEYLLKLYTNGKKQKIIPKKIMNSFYNYDWTGNVRELQNVVQRFLVVNEQEFVGPSDLDFLGASGVKRQKNEELIKNTTEEIIDFRTTVNNFEKNLILKALEKNHWHKANAASSLGLPRRTFFRKLSDHELI